MDIFGTMARAGALTTLAAAQAGQRSVFPSAFSSLGPLGGLQQSNPLVQAMALQLLGSLARLNGAWSGLGNIFGAGHGLPQLPQTNYGQYGGGGLGLPSLPQANYGGSYDNLYAAGGAQAGGGQGSQGGRIGPGSKVLVIGDSHLNTAFGTTLDRDLRSTGASVETFGSGASTPDWWVDGTATHEGSVSIGPDGQISRTGGGVAKATPKLQDLIQQYHPDTVVVELGQNIRGKDPAEVKRQVQNLERVAQANGTHVVWVGSPPTGSDANDGGQSYRQYNNFLRSVVGNGATFVDSGAIVPRYQGNDGIHYADGPAAQWANGVFRAIQG